MGKGDKRSKKGKIWRSSYGNARPKTKKTVRKAVNG
ncbi:MAG TPA: 30S ribosomal protein THX [Saprospiraceae bacterium]|nr:30S ribosomal protein THX [Saprospiraceae bacterium]HMQ82248.1 30S ribosomal protein THX [Saprospiraceae bacterium]